MKTLDLRIDNGLAGIHGMTDKEFIEKELQSWISSDERSKQLESLGYYQGQHDILKRERKAIVEDGKLETVENLPNNRIVDNQYAKMVDQKSNYLCGKPITFDTQNKNLGTALTSIFNAKVQRTMRILAEKALIGGKAWLFPYYRNNEFAFAPFPAHEILPFWVDAEHTELDCAVHYFSIWEYDEKGIKKIVNKAEVIHGGGIERFNVEDGVLKPDNDLSASPYITVEDANGNKQSYNWERMPLICFKYNHIEQPLLCRVKCLQDALNLMLSNLANNLEEDVRNTILVVKNYDGEDLGEFRRNLATYGAVKVETTDNAAGDVTTLKIEVNGDNYKLIIDLLKKAIIENARGYDAKDERMSSNPNQMNIQSMYSDIDLDTNGMETEFQASFYDLMWFVKVHLKNTGAGDFTDENVKVIFNRDVLVNESEAIDNCGKSMGIISSETIVRQHPWINDPEEELKRIEQEKQSEVSTADTYRNAFENTSNSGDGAVDE